MRGCRNQMQLKLRRRNENQRTFRRHSMTAVFRLSPQGKVRKYYASLVRGMSSDCQQTVKPANSENTYCQTISLLLRPVVLIWNERRSIEGIGVLRRSRTCSICADHRTAEFIP